MGGGVQLEEKLCRLVVYPSASQGRRQVGVSISARAFLRWERIAFPEMDPSQTRRAEKAGEELF